MSRFMKRVLSYSHIINNNVHHSTQPIIATNTKKWLPQRSLSCYAHSNKWRLPCVHSYSEPRKSLVVSMSSDTSLLKGKADAVEEKIHDKLYRSMIVECRGLDKAVLRSYSQYVAAASKHLQISLENIEFPKYKLTRYTVLKSVFAHGKHKVQYEIRTYYVILHLRNLTSSTADTFLEYIERNLPEGVALKITKEELMKLPQHVKASTKVSPQLN